MIYTEGSPFIATNLILGKHTLFEADLTRLQNRYPQNDHKYRAHLLPASTEALDELVTTIKEHGSDWDISDRDWEDMHLPVKTDGTSKHGYANAQYLMSSARVLSPPSLFTVDQVMLAIDAPRHEQFYTGAPVSVQLCPLLYESEEGKTGVSLIVEAIAIMADDKQRYPNMQVKQRRNIQLFLQQSAG